MQQARKLRSGLSHGHAFWIELEILLLRSKSPQKSHCWAKEADAAGSDRGSVEKVRQNKEKTVVFRSPEFARIRLDSRHRESIGSQIAAVFRSLIRRHEGSSRNSVCTSCRCRTGKARS